MRAAVIMTSGTLRRVAVGQVDVTVAAVQFDMEFVKLQTGDSVTEILLVPAAVTVITDMAKLFNLLAGWMAGTTTQTLVKPVKCPTAVSGMSEGRFFPGVVARRALVFTMAVIAYSVDFFVGFAKPQLLLQVVAIAAVLSLVAVNALQFEQVNVFLVMERYNRTFLIRRRPHLCMGHGYNRVRNTDDVGRVGGRGRKISYIGRQVAHNTLGVMAPLPVTPHTLTMVCSFQPRFPERLRFLGIAPVTFCARWEVFFRAIMVTYATASTHVNHLSVMPVVELYRAI